MLPYILTIEGDQLRIYFRIPLFFSNNIKLMYSSLHLQADLKRIVRLISSVLSVSKVKALFQRSNIICGGVLLAKAMIKIDTVHAVPFRNTPFFVYQYTEISAM